MPAPRHSPSPKPMCCNCAYWHRNRFLNRDHGYCEILSSGDAVPNQESRWSLETRVRTSCWFGCTIFKSKYEVAYAEVEHDLQRIAQELDDSTRLTADDYSVTINCRDITR